MYYITIELDFQMIDKSDNPESYYNEIRNFLESENFIWEQKELYFSNGKDPVESILTIQKLSKEFSWFYNICKKCELLRIEEKVDIIPAMEYVAND